MNASVAEASTTITLTVNGGLHTTTARTLAQWVEQQGQLPQAVATALNGEFVPRNLRATQTLSDGDTIITFQPIEGG
ncbi:sulfur carrier protein ThiS [Rhodoferax sp. AJA081-3]|uniref:sulfur carrier protein ThiS n=1 Tax=Rhodoferax sp. AJA081-3 TaxID=2752316 RepID=UPI001ADF8096|nr:sulfur carrier protein ThiS [Rhodoferax sp. AJA081-3]QTN30201.1 sulfur carrier protein ThiS [Rhodoferax sp. AJA081-3]